MNLRETFYHYGDKEFALSCIPFECIDLYLTHVSAYRQFKTYAANEMFETIEALYEGHGYKMTHEMEHYIQNKESLTDQERTLLSSFLKGDHDTFEFTARMIFMDRYDFTEPQSL